MGRQRVNPFDTGSAERLLYDRYRKATALALQQERARDGFAVDAAANRAKAEEYAKALRALGHGDKVPGQVALPNFATATITLNPGSPEAPAV